MHRPLTKRGRMKTREVFVSGVLAGAAMSVVMAFARMLGLPVRIELILGTLFVDPGPAAWLIGLVAFLVGSGLIALLYGVGFEYVAHRAGTKTGIALSLIHIVVGGAFLGALPAIHPRVTEMLQAPGPYLANLGIIGILAFVALHLMYGALVGGLYGDTVHAPRGRVYA